MPPFVLSSKAAQELTALVHGHRHGKYDVTQPDRDSNFTDTPIFVGAPTADIGGESTGAVCIHDPRDWSSFDFTLNVRNLTSNTIKKDTRVYVYRTNTIWTIGEIPYECPLLELRKCGSCCDDCNSTCTDSTSCDKKYVNAISGTTLGSLDEFVGKTVRTSTGGCYFVKCAGGDSTETGTSINVLNVYSICDDCKCVELNPCSTSLSNVKTYVPILSAGYSTGDYVSISSTAAAGFNCYKIIAATTSCTGAINVTLASSTAQCTDCKCFVLDPCSTSDSTIKTFTQLASMGYSTGDYLYITSSGSTGCYQFTSLSTSCTGAISVSIPTGYQTAFASCTECQNSTGLYYSLTNDCGASDSCSTAGNSTDYQFIVDDDLSASVGKYVKFKGKCYSVATSTSTGNDTVEIEGTFDTCEFCTTSPYSGEITLYGKVKIASNVLKQETKILTVSDGLITSICDGDDITIPSTTC